MRKLILNVHLCFALIAGAFIVLLAGTGIVMEFEPELDRLLHPRLSYVAHGKLTLPLTKIGDIVSQRFGGDSVVAYLPSLSPSWSYQVAIPSGMVYVNQYTGEVLGLRTRGQNFAGYIFAEARVLHIRLATGRLGANILKWSAIGLVLSLVCGLYLWWPAKQVRIRGKWGSGKFWLDLHNAIGNLVLHTIGCARRNGRN